MSVTDKLVLVASLAGLVTLYALLWLDGSGAGAAHALTVTVGDERRVLALSGDRAVKLQGAQGASTVRIRHGRARFVHSPCRRQLCVHAGWLDERGDTAACLPNRIMLRMGGDSANRYDAINF